jgi:ferritin-like metal-binding protein YciE
MPSKITSLHEVFIDQLKDLYSAETQIAKALPKMAKAAAAADLKNGFKLHLQQTKEHAARIKSICAALKEKPTGKTCQATAGLVKEGQEAIDEDALPEMKDLMLIAAARRVEHYEISGYTSACELAKALGHGEALKALSTTLAEESATDAKLAKASIPAVAQARDAEKSTANANKSVFSKSRQRIPMKQPSRQRLRLKLAASRVEKRTGDISEKKVSLSEGAH